MREYVWKTMSEQEYSIKMDLKNRLEGLRLSGSR